MFPTVSPWDLISLILLVAMAFAAAASASNSSADHIEQRFEPIGSSRAEPSSPTMARVSRCAKLNS